jgi:hypothetical protein
VYKEGLREKQLRTERFPLVLKSEAHGCYPASSSRMNSPGKEEDRSTFKAERSRDIYDDNK